MRAQVRAANPCAARIVAKLVLKCAIQNKDFFTAIMLMFAKKSIGCPTHQRGVRGAELIQRHH